MIQTPHLNGSVISRDSRSANAHICRKSAILMKPQTPCIAAERTVVTMMSTVYSLASCSLSAAYGNVVHAEVCYVYLVDVDSTEARRRRKIARFGAADGSNTRGRVRRCLVQRAFFFSSDWSMVGTKINLANATSDMMGIQIFIAVPFYIIKHPHCTQGVMSKRTQ